MKLIFVKENKFVHEVSMTDIEPLTYMSYKDIPTFLYTSSVTVNKLCPDFLGEKGILFALIFTKETITPYYAPNICNLRYGIQGNMVLRYKLLDPVNRMVCEKIEFYLVDNVASVEGFTIVSTSSPVGEKISRKKKYEDYEIADNKGKIIGLE